MNFLVCSIYDVKTQAYFPPVFLQTKGQAIRSFTDAVNGRDAEISAHPEDYTLFELGNWCDSNAKFVMHDAPIPLGVAIEFKKTE